MSIYNKKYWHALSPSLHFVRHEGRLVPGGGEGGGGRNPYMKAVVMLVVSLRGVNFGFWSHLGFSGQNAFIFSREGLV